MPSGLDSSTLHRMVDEGILSKENIFDEPPRYKNARTNQDIPQLFSYPLSLGGVAEVMTDQAAREKISSI